MAEEKPCQNHDVRLLHVEQDTQEQWEAINKLRNRLPVWAVFLIAALSGALGWALQLANTAARLAAIGK